MRVTVSVRAVPATVLAAGALSACGADEEGGNGDTGEGGRRVTMRAPDPAEAAAAPDRVPKAPGAPGSRTPR
ncbi:hypothetical protein [Streptomyces yangpuensis]|uniref:hypothetical protein n=1 Tax=Streptomyces yangpuensis TaxID=1648182 RepID=UPI0035DD1077